MKKQKGFTLIELIVVFAVLIIPVSWIWNFVKLTDCDFDANYRCELIHGFGVIVPPASVVTVWFATDAKE